MPWRCKQYSAAQRHNGWCVCRRYWTVDPIISWGREREAKAPPERDKGWLTQPKTRGPLWTVCASAAAKRQWDSALMLGNDAEQLQEVGRSSISLFKRSREEVITWRKTLRVITTVSATCRGTFPVEIQVAHTSRRQNLSQLQRTDTIYSWETRVAKGKKRITHTLYLVHSTSSQLQFVNSGRYNGSCQRCKKDTHITFQFV